MTHHLTRNIILAALVVAVAAPARALDTTVTSGLYGVVASVYALVEGSCTTTAMPGIVITTAPKFGTAQVRKLNGQPTSGPCVGRTFPATTIVYKAKSGYHGVDQISYRVTYVDHASGSPVRQSVDRSVTITVK